MREKKLPGVYPDTLARDYKGRISPASVQPKWERGYLAVPRRARPFVTRTKNDLRYN